MLVKKKKKSIRYACLADKLRYRHNCRADKRYYRHNCRMDKPYYWHESSSSIKVHPSETRVLSNLTVVRISSVISTTVVQIASVDVWPYVNLHFFNKVASQNKAQNHQPDKNVNYIFHYNIDNLIP